MNWDVGFVTSTMQEIGVQLPRLLEVYDQLFKTRVQATSASLLCMCHGEKLPLQSWPVEDQLVFGLQDPCWQRVRKPLHLVECIHVLLSGYVDDPSRVPTYDR